MVEDIIVYDDDCSFCTDSVEFLVSVSDRGYRLVGFSELDDELLGLLPEDYEDCFHVVSGGVVFSCGEGVRYVLSGGDLHSVRFKALKLPVVEGFVDSGYEFVARNRGYIGRLF